MHCCLKPTRDSDTVPVISVDTCDKSRESRQVVIERRRAQRANQRTVCGSSPSNVNVPTTLRGEAILALRFCGAFCFRRREKSALVKRALSRSSSLTYTRASSLEHTLKRHGTRSSPRDSSEEARPRVHPGRMGRKPRDGSVQRVSRREIPDDRRARREGPRVLPLRPRSRPRRRSPH